MSERLAKRAIRAIDAALGLVALRAVMVQTMPRMDAFGSDSEHGKAAWFAQIGGGGLSLLMTARRLGRLRSC